MGVRGSDSAVRGTPSVLLCVYVYIYIYISRTQGAGSSCCFMQRSSNACDGVTIAGIDRGSLFRGPLTISLYFPYWKTFILPNAYVNKECLICKRASWQRTGIDYPVCGSMISMTIPRPVRYVHVYVFRAHATGGLWSGGLATAPKCILQTMFENLAQTRLASTPVTQTHSENIQP